MKKLISILMILVLALSFAGCKKNGEDKKGQTSSTQNPGAVGKDLVCNVYGIAGPTGVGLANLMQDIENGNMALDYDIKIAANNDEIVAKLSNKEADIAAVATNLAASLYNKTEGEIVVLAVNTLGVLNVIAKNVDIKEIGDLKGKTVYLTGQGANPEYIVNDILKQNNVTDVKLEFVSQPTELVTKVTTNEQAVVIAPQPVATAITVKDASAKIVLNINDEWNKLHDEQLTMGCIVARKEFVEESPASIGVFLMKYKESIEKANKDIDGTAALCEKYKIVTPAAVAKKAIPLCNIVYQDGDAMKTNLSAYLKFLFDANPKSIGGKLPSDDFYYAK